MSQSVSSAGPSGVSFFHILWGGFDEVLKVNTLELRDSGGTASLYVGSDDFNVNGWII